jgi:hypothetical protein
MSTFKFQEVLPKKARFVNAEDVSPTKLTGIFKQIESAISTVRSFLGNGPDYTQTVDSDRKFLGNISSAIGRGDKLYNPINRFANLKSIKDNIFSADATAVHDDANDTLTFTASFSDKGDIAIGSYIFFEYMVSGADPNDFTFCGQYVDQASTSTTEFRRFSFKQITTPTTFSLDITNAASVIFKSIGIVDPEYADAFETIIISGNGYSGAMNQAYCIPFENLKYYKVAVPCAYSLSCLHATCKYCVGNTYDSNGFPICDGAPYEYTPATNAYASYRTIQSPLFTSATYSKTILGSLTEFSTTTQYPYLIKNMPFRKFSIDDTIVDAILPENMLALYDIKNNTNPIFENMNFYVAANFRSDIVYIKSSGESLDLGDDKRYLLLGGDKGLSDFFVNMLKKL